MEASEAYEAGREALASAWSKALDGERPQLPVSVAASIASVMATDSQVSQRYALPTQLLLALVVGNADRRRAKDFPEVDGQFSARSFAKETVVSVEEIGRRIGTSSDPYVTNPLRQERLGDQLVDGRGGERWQALFDILQFVSENPERTEDVLVASLGEVKDRAMAVADETPPSAEEPSPVDLASLVEATGLDQDEVLDIVDALNSDQPQVILSGPPGTSKTHAAVALASYLTAGDEGRYRVVQFHPSYGYEEFIEGLRPTATDGSFQFEVQPGAVLRMSEDMSEGETWVLILDEMNRANLPRVLGELLYAIERRESPVDLMYSQGFRLPKRLVFIGTMNTADRSIRGIDAAVRRRFQIFDFPPNGQVLGRFYESHPNEVPDLVQGFNALNVELTKALDRHHTIGHAFLMDRRGMTASRLRQVWDRQIRPLIDEYLFDQPEVLTSFTLELFWPSTNDG